MAIASIVLTGGIACSTSMAMTNDPAVVLGHVEGGGGELSSASSRSNKSTTCSRSVQTRSMASATSSWGAPSEYLHRGRRLVGRNLGAILVIVECLALSALQ
jgi:hypothetical protein